MGRTDRWICVALVAGYAGTATAKEQDPTPKVASVGFRYGPLTLNDPSIAKVYGTDGLGLLRLDYAMTWDLFEIGMGVGFFQELGFQINSGSDDNAGSQTDEHIMLTMWPLDVDAALKLDVLHEQPLVPYVRAGADMWLWTENWGSRFGTGEIPYDKLSGGKGGWHWAVGGMVLLDFLDRKTADRVEAVSGINDTFFVVEYRKTQMFASDGLDLGSTELSFGLKLDF